MKRFCSCGNRINPDDEGICDDCLEALCGDAEMVDYYDNLLANEREDGDDE